MNFNEDFSNSELLTEKKLLILKRKAGEPLLLFYLYVGRP